jgi:hypothetical protein
LVAVRQFQRLLLRKIPKHSFTIVFGLLEGATNFHKKSPNSKRNKTGDLPAFFYYFMKSVRIKLQVKVFIISMAARFGVLF